MSSWLSNILHRTYQPLSTGSGTESRNGSSANLPGAYPEETVEPASRNIFNSQSLNQYATNVWDTIQMIIFKPIIFVLYIIIRVVAKFINTIYFRDHFKNRSQLSHSNNDPIDKANKFIRDLEDNLDSTGSLPGFFQGSYTQALFMATNKAKFLFVYLTNPENENSSSTFHNIIANPKFISIFNDPNVIIWGGDLTNPESYQLANSLNVTKFPFLGLLCLTRNTTMTPEGPVKTAPKISLLVKIQGNVHADVNVDDMIENKFIKKIKKYEPELKLIRNELWEKFLNQVITQQQNANYQKSLAQDKLKKELKKREHLQKEYLIWKSQYFKNLNMDEVQDKAKVAIKLPDGERITYLFPGDIPVDEIFTYVELYRNEYFYKTFDIIEDESKFKDFVPEYKFQLKSPLPPKVTLNDYLNTRTLIKDINCIYPNGLLIVEDLE